MPGPANYERKRMFDNKQAIDYTKRFGTSLQAGYNTATVGFTSNQHAALNEVSSSGNDWNGSKEHFHSKPLPIDSIIDSSIQSRKASHKDIANKQENLRKEIMMLHTQ